jgi:hypothetical protein
VKEYVFINKRTGELGLAIGFNYADQPEDQELMNLEGYRVSLRPNVPDAWAIQPSEGHPWVMVTAAQTEALENLGEL